MSEPNWLDEHEQAAWRGFMSMHASVNAELARRLAIDSSLSYQDYEVLVVLTDQSDGERRVLELAEQLGWEKSRLSHHVTRMADRGLLTKRPCETDGRGFVVSVSAKGRREIEKAAPGHVEAVRELFIDRLEPDQIDALVAMTERVLADDSSDTDPEDA